jgi:3-deoxy-7-phosphoheptulonate synthase
MSVIMKPDATRHDVEAVLRAIESYGLRTDIMRGDFQKVIGIIGDEKKIAIDQLKLMPGVQDAIAIQVPYRLVSRQYIQKDIVVKVGDVSIGGQNPPVYIAGPCSIESYDQLNRIAKKVKEAGANVLRGGAYKPRSSIHSFQGLGLEGLKHLQAVGKDLNIPTITEVRSELDVDVVAEHTDALQIGARNMYNQDLIEAAARTSKPVLLKRSFSAQIDEYLGFAERLAANKNKKIMLCERGILPLGGSTRSQTRYTFDLNAIPVLRKETPFPVIADPSHATGRRDLILPMSRAAIACGANGLMIEVHDKPQEALSDAAQAYDPGNLESLIQSCNRVFASII